MPAGEAKARYVSFQDFYPFYISQHLNPTCRALHVIGTFLSVVWFVAAISTSHWIALIFFPTIGYACSWMGHFFFEKNRPAAFNYFFYSFMGDLKMCFEVLTFQRPIKEN